jgi:hypothetical protein
MSSDRLTMPPGPVILMIAIAVLAGCSANEDPSRCVASGLEQFDQGAATAKASTDRQAAETRIRALCAQGAQDHK